VIAAVVAGNATKSVPPWLWFGVLIVFLIGFFLFEKQQTDLRHRFSLRVLVIEDVMQCHDYSEPLVGNREAIPSFGVLRVCISSPA
jgi:hypothetical protein